MYKLHGSLLLSAVLGAVLPVTAQASETPEQWQGVFGFDNDVFAGRDDYYSNGIYAGAGFVSDEIHNSPLPGPIATLALPGIDVEGRHVSCGISLVQRIFTPEDLSRSDRIEDDLAANWSSTPRSPPRMSAGSAPGL